MVAALGLFEHREIRVHLGLVLERRAVDALELRVALVALVIRAGHMRELERADVAGAHDVRPGAEIEKIAVLEIRNRLAFGNVLNDVQLEFGGCASITKRSQTAFLCISQSLFTRD